MNKILQQALAYLIEFNGERVYVAKFKQLCNNDINIAILFQFSEQCSEYNERARKYSVRNRSMSWNYLEKQNMQWEIADSFIYK
jgi:hypothetical protein